MSEPALREFDAPADRIRLHLQGASGRVLIVEGPTDAEVLGDLLNDIDIFPLGSRVSVLATASELMTSGVAAFLAVIDVDFLPAPTGADWDSVLYPYDGRDLESMLVDLGGLSRLIRYKGSSQKIETCGGADALVSRLQTSVEPVTRLRSHNAIGSLGWRFDAVKLVDKIDPRTLDLLIDSYCAALAGASGCTVGPLRAIAGEATRNPGPARGKDVVAAASVALRRLAGSLARAACDPDVLARDLLAASSLLLRDSQWFAELSRRLSAA